jgi:hypothetical protein
MTNRIDRFRDYFSEHFYLTVPFTLSFIITILLFLFIPDLNQYEDGIKYLMFAIVYAAVLLVIGITWELLIFGGW